MGLGEDTLDHIGDYDTGSKDLIDDIDVDLKDSWTEGDLSEASQLVKEDLDGLDKLSFLGLDLKVQPNGEVRMIEGHCAGFGTKGFEQIPPGYNQLTHFKNVLGGELAERYLRMDLDNDLGQTRNLKGAIKYGAVNDQMHQGLQNAFEEVYKFNFNKPRDRGLTFSGSVLPMELQKASESVVNQLGLGLGYNEDVYELLSDKHRTSKELEPFTPRSLELGNLDDSNSERIAQGEITVLKTKHGAQGKNVYMLPSDEIRGRTSEEIIDHFFTNTGEYTHEEIGEGYILQEFIPSKPIPHEHELDNAAEIDGSPYRDFSLSTTDTETRQHDGCARYVCAVEEYGGEIEVHPIHAYWRLAPEPMSSDSEDSIKANYSQGAIPAQVSTEDQRRMDQAVAKYIPTIFE